MGRLVKCKICGTKIDSSSAYCVTKVNEKTGKQSKSYFCSQIEYEEDKYNKSLWTENLKLIDYIIGFKSISKVKVKGLKEIENAGYTRKKIYNCLKNNAENIKKNLEEKNIYEEYNKIQYVLVSIKNKIKDYSENEQIQIGSTYEPMDCLEETDEDIFRRLEHDRNNHKESIIDIIKRVNGEGDK